MKQAVILAVFAEKDTSRKILLAVLKDQKASAALELTKIHGGDWVYLTMIDPNEGFIFKDDRNFRSFAAVSEFTDQHIFKLNKPRL